MPLSLHAARLIDGTGRDPQKGRGIVIEGDRIVAVEPGIDHARSEVLDLDGLTVLPGLIDAHSHVGLGVGADDPDTAPGLVAARIFHNCELALDAGFTTMRDVGGIDGGIASAVDQGLVRGPRLLPSGPLLSQTGGHTDTNPRFGHGHHHVGPGRPGLAQQGMVADGADAMRAAAREAFRRGATQLKVCAGGGLVSVRDPWDQTQFTIDELRAAVEEAAARATYVTAHSHNNAGIRNGLAAGIECFEHGTFLDEETAAAMAEASAHLVPTCAVIELLRDESYDALDDHGRRVVDDACAALERSLKVARAAGVVLGSGSDLVGAGQRRRGLEITIRARLENDAMAAIVSATRDNAQILRRPELGTIEPGKVADMIAVDGDPLTDPSVLADDSRIIVVIKDGQVVKDHRK